MEEKRRGDFYFIILTMEVAAITTQKMRSEQVNILHLPEPGATLVLLVVIASIMITFGVKFSFIRYIWFYAPKERPINHMILKDQVKCLVKQEYSQLIASFQVLALLSYGFFSVMLAFSIFHRKSLEGIFGEEFCGLFSGLFIGYHGFHSLGSCSNAIYRLIIVKWRSALDRKISNTQVLGLFWLVEGLIFCFLMVIYIQGMNGSKIGQAMSVCSDRTYLMMKTLSIYERGGEALYLEKFTEGMMMQMIVWGVMLATTLVEAIVYLAIFWDVHKSNRRVGSTVQPALIESRNQGHILTTSGQAFLFLVQLSLYFRTVVLLRPEWNIMEGSWGLVLMCLDGALISILQLISSPELRKFLLQS